MYIPAVSWRDEVVLRANWVRNTDCMSQNWRKKLQTTTQAYLQVWKTFVWTLFVCLHLHFILCNWHCLELQLFEPTLCKLFKLNIKNNYWTDCFFRYHTILFLIYVLVFSSSLSIHLHVCTLFAPLCLYMESPHSPLCILRFQFFCHWSHHILCSCYFILQFDLVF